MSVNQRAIVLDAAQLYERRWFETVLERALADLQKEYELRGRMVIFERLQEHLERGPIGVIGLLLLILATARYLRRLLAPRLPLPWHQIVPRAWAGTPVISCIACLSNSM